MKSDRSQQEGFSLLEAVVAMAILATSGLALFGWVSQSYAGLIRLQDAQDRHQLMDDLHAYFSTLNIRQEGSQQLSINGFDVIWTARLAEPMQMGMSLSGGSSKYKLGLYDVSIAISRDDRSVGDYETRLVGYQQTKNPNAVSP